MAGGLQRVFSSSMEWAVVVTSIPRVRLGLTLGTAHSKGRYRKDLPLEARIQFSHLHPNALKFRACGGAARSASRAAPSANVHCQATSGSLPSPPGCLTNISPAGSPIATRTAEALRRTSRTSAAKPGLA